jgi:uncharacterized protein (DUF885 family)
MSFLVIALWGVLGVGLVWLIYSLLWGTPPLINLAVERMTLRIVQSDPEILTQIGLLDNSVLDFHSGQLTDVSPRGDAHRRQIDRDGLSLIRRYNPNRLAGQKRVTYQLMRWYFEQNLRGHRFSYHWYGNPVFMGPYPVNHICGVQVDLIQFLCTYHRIKGRRSLRRYLRRLNQVPWKLAGLMTGMLTRAAEGVIPPRFVLEKSLIQINGFLADPVENNPLYTHVMEKMIESGRFSPRARARWAIQVQKAIEDYVRPAYVSLAAVLQDLIDKATDEDGVWKLPDGEAYYAYLLRHHTTSDLSATEIHQLGLDEVARLSQSIQEVLQEMGFSPGAPGQQLKALREDPQYHYHSDDPQAEIIADYQAILDEANQRMPEIFNDGSLDEIIVERLPEFKEPDSPIAYAQAPAMDGSRPGKMWLNLRQPDDTYRWGMHTLAYHEGIPGHVYQMAQAQKIKGIPTFRRVYFFNAYAEGWALYAEHLGWELNLEDPFAKHSNLGRLQALLWRAVRLVVDTGIHSMGWTRQEAIDYMLEKTGLPERDVVTEVERYIVMPGQACAYYLGYLEILSLRQKAQATLGEAFDLCAFHDVILHQGGLPLPLLQEVVNSYIDQAAGLVRDV